MRFLCLGLMLTALAPNTRAQVAGCTDLNTVSPPVPPFTQFSLQLNIASIFQANCGGCHINGGASGSLNLDIANIIAQTANVPSAQNAAITRMIPGDAANSLLFQKINCETPSVGGRMPLGGDPLSNAQQRIIQDWINAGAPIMKGGFEDR
jgi:mono/diheme cytochrome c family protein